MKGIQVLGYRASAGGRIRANGNTCNPSVRDHVVLDGIKQLNGCSAGEGGFLSPPHGQRACIESRQDAQKQRWKWKVKKSSHHTEHSSVESVRPLEKKLANNFEGRACPCDPSFGVSDPKRSRASRAPGWCKAAGEKSDAIHRRRSQVAPRRKPPSDVTDADCTSMMAGLLSDSFGKATGTREPPTSLSCTPPQRNCKVEKKNWPKNPRRDFWGMGNITELTQMAELKESIIVDVEIYILDHVHHDSTIGPNRQQLTAKMIQVEWPPGELVEEGQWRSMGTEKEIKSRFEAGIRGGSFKMRRS
ncbi:hypothetical protein B0H14DRAFT_2563164 [Mycena olivaceomarginata]|nr:hypothetical protein B0H14DRAFT_2563164 [Mycena olivaceomarginata]